MFPVTDDSATIVECLSRTAATKNVRVRHRMWRVGGGEKNEIGVCRDAFLEGNTFVRTGCCSRRAVGGVQPAWLLRKKLGHTIEPLVPSLFTFHIDDPRLKELAGLSVPDAVVNVGSAKLREQGPLLITHWGLSGPGDSETVRLGGTGAACDRLSIYADAQLGGRRPLETRAVGAGGSASGQSAQAGHHVESTGCAATVVGKADCRGRCLRRRWSGPRFRISCSARSPLRRRPANLSCGQEHEQREFVTCAVFGSARSISKRCKAASVRVCILQAKCSTSMA